MRASRITVLAAAALIAVPLAGLSTASAASGASALPASFGATDTGYGPTFAAAEQNARKTLQGDYGPYN